MIARFLDIRISAPRFFAAILAINIAVFAVQSAILYFHLPMSILVGVAVYFMLANHLLSAVAAWLRMNSLEFNIGKRLAFYGVSALVLIFAWPHGHAIAATPLVFVRLIPFLFLLFWPSPAPAESAAKAAWTPTPLRAEPGLPILTVTLSTVVAVICQLQQVAVLVVFLGVALMSAPVLPLLRTFPAAGAMFGMIAVPGFLLIMHVVSRRGRTPFADSVYLICLGIYGAGLSSSFFALRGFHG